MTYVMYDAAGTLGDIASIQGYRALSLTVRSLKAAGPIIDFLDDGNTTDMQGVITDIDNIMPRISNSEVKSTLQNLRDKLSKAEEIAIVSQ